MTRLDELLAQITREHVYIQTHNFPDPDAIASAFGMQELLKTRGIASTICYRGRVDRYSTEKMCQYLGIDMMNIEDIADCLSVSDEVILVDAQKGNANIIDIAGEEIICIDHHPTFEEQSYRFSDIRPEVGACASMIAQYFLENDVPIDERVATALSFGIRMDTKSLLRGASKLDMEMMYRLFDKCNHSIINSLENSNLYFEDLLAYSKAIYSIRVYDSISFADTGRNCPEGLIASVSDFMLALVEVNFSIVYSRKDEGIKLSVRSELSELDAGKIARDALAGIGNGGGHAEMAGGFVPFKGNDEQADMLVREIQERFYECITKRAGYRK